MFHYFIFYDAYIILVYKFTLFIFAVILLMIQITIEFLVHTLTFVWGGLKKGMYKASRKIIKKLSVVIPFRRSLVRHQEEKLYQKNNQIDQNKFIIAVQLNKLIINKSKKYEPGYSQLLVDIQKSWWERMTSWYIDYGYYYKKTKYGIDFLGLLKKLQNTEVILYTSQQKAIAEKLLQNLGLKSYFPPSRRYYRNNCTIISKNAKKLPVYIQKKNTARLIILTPDLNSECDDSNGSDKYFLQIRQPDDSQKLLEYIKLLKDVFQSNKKIQYLHDQLLNQRLRRNL